MALLPALRPGIYVVLQYDYVENMLELRTPHRPAHLAILQEAKERGDLLNAGAFGAADSAMFVFAPDAEPAAHAFVDVDP